MFKIFLNSLMKVFSLKSSFLPEVIFRTQVKREVATWDVSVKEWGHLYSFWHQYLCCNVKSDWFCSVQLCWSCINFRFSIADIFHGIISFWEKTTVPSFKHLSQCSVNIICAISLLFLIQSRQQLKVKWFPISWNTFSFNRTMKKHRDSNIKCLQRVFFLWWVDSG